jgi:hypothetical protein
MATGRLGGALAPLIGGELIAMERPSLSLIALVLALPLV